MKTGDTAVINEDEVALAIRASCSIPLIFKPVKIGSKLLVDGGLSLPVPVSVVKKMGADLVITVNLDADYFANNKGVLLKTSKKIRPMNIKNLQIVHKQAIEIMFSR